MHECYAGLMNPNAKGRCAVNGEIITAELVEGRTCLGKCGTWKSKDNFHVSRTGSLRAYCHDCVRDNNRGSWEAGKDNPEYMQRKYESTQRTRDKLKQDVIAAYGGKCICCGEARIEFLTLDHVNNDGAEHRRTHKVQGGAGTWFYARKHHYPDMFQLLCWNCNCAKAIYGQCPHTIS